jgi:hypothetical protein
VVIIGIVFCLLVVSSLKYNVQPFWHNANFFPIKIKKSCVYI